MNTISYIDISKDADLATKHKIAVIPTIIILKMVVFRLKTCGGKHIHTELAMVFR